MHQRRKNGVRNLCVAMLLFVFTQKISNIHCNGNNIKDINHPFQLELILASSNAHDPVRYPVVLFVKYSIPSESIKETVFSERAHIMLLVKKIEIDRIINTFLLN